MFYVPVLWSPPFPRSPRQDYKQHRLYYNGALFLSNLQNFSPKHWATSTHIKTFFLCSWTALCVTSHKTSRECCGQFRMFTDRRRKSSEISQFLSILVFFLHETFILGQWGVGVVGIIRMLANNEINNTFPCSVSRTRHAESQNGDKKAAQNKKA